MTFLEFVDVLTYASVLSGLPVSMLFLIIVKNKTSVSNILFFIILLSLLCEISNFFFITCFVANSYYISNIWTISNLCLVAYFFSLLLPNLKRLISLIILVFSLFMTISFFFYDLSHPNPVINTFSSITIIFFVVFSFYSLIKAEITIPMLQNPIFWILSGFFLFETSILMQGLFLDYLIYTLKIDSKSLMYLNIFSMGANMIKNFIFLPYAFLLVSKGHSIEINNPKYKGSWQEF